MLVLIIFGIFFFPKIIAEDENVETDLHTSLIIQVIFNTQQMLVRRLERNGREKKKLILFRS